MIKNYSPYRIQCNKRQADKCNKQHAHIYKLQDMMYKDKTNTVFSVQCGVKGLQDTLHFTTEFKKKKKNTLKA